MKVEVFSEIVNDATAKYNKIKKEDYLSSGLFSIIDQGQKFIGGYTNDETLVTDIEKEFVIFGDHTKVLKFINYPVAIGADGVKVLHINKEKADPKYVYYFLKSIKLIDAGYSRHFKFLKEIEIPITESINDQIRIADILTKSETLINQRKESILILDELLKSSFLEMFGDVLLNSKKWPLQSFETLVRLKRGYDLPKAERRSGIYPIFASSSIIDYHDEYKVKGPGVITGRSGTIGVVNYSNNEFWPLNTTLYSERYDGNIIYIQYFLEHFKLERFSNGAGVPTLNRNLLHHEEIIDVPLELQNEFAAIVEKVGILKQEYQRSLVELENMYGVLSQKAFKGDLIESEETGEDKKKSDTAMKEEPDEIINIKDYTQNKKEKVDITNMTFADYVEFPEEFQIRDEKWMSLFLGQDEFYQFLLKDTFKDVSFTLIDIETKLHNFFYQGLDMDFDNEQWRAMIFQFMKAEPPLIVQKFEEDSATIKLKLTDEAYKA